MPISEILISSIVHLNVHTVHLEMPHKNLM